MPDPSLLSLSAIETPRLRLRPCSYADAGQFQALTNDTAICGAVEFLTFPFELDDAKRLIHGRGDGRDCFWGAWRDADLIGTVGTHLRAAHEIEMGYWFAQASRGRGLASEAVSAIIESLRRSFPDRSIVAECRPENRASWRLLERAGFRPDGQDGQRSGRKRLVFGG